MCKTKKWKYIGKKNPKGKDKWGLCSQFSCVVNDLHYCLMYLILLLFNDLIQWCFTISHSFTDGSIVPKKMEDHDKQIDHSSSSNTPTIPLGQQTLKSQWCLQPSSLSSTLASRLSFLIISVCLHTHIPSFTELHSRVTCLHTFLDFFKQCFIPEGVCDALITWNAYTVHVVSSVFAQWLGVAAASSEL